MNSHGRTARHTSTGPAPAAKTGSARTALPARPCCGPRATLPSAEQLELVTAVLQDYPSWSVFWDKRHQVWRAAEDDPDSELYTQSSDVHAIIGYITAQS
jgi:hypothetical protein